MKVIILRQKAKIEVRSSISLFLYIHQHNSKLRFFLCKLPTYYNWLFPNRIFTIFTGIFVFLIDPKTHLRLSDVFFCLFQPFIKLCLIFNIVDKAFFITISTEIISLNRQTGSKSDRQRPINIPMKPTIYRMIILIAKFISPIQTVKPFFLHSDQLLLLAFRNIEKVFIVLFITSVKPD